MKTPCRSEVLLRLLIISFLFVTACSAEESSVVGTWHDRNNVFEFRSDGTVNFHDGPAVMSGTYTFQNGRLSMDLGSAGGLVEWKAVISGDALILTFNDGKKMTLGREDDPAPARPRDAAVEARDRAEQEWGSRWVQQGDTWTAQSDSGNFLLQVKKRVLVSVPSSLTEADRLNGVDWAGSVKFDVSAYRIYHFNAEKGFMGQGGFSQGWGDWVSHEGSLWILKLTKRNGRWIVDSDDISLNEGDFAIRVFQPVRPRSSPVPR